MVNQINSQDQLTANKLTTKIVGQLRRIKEQVMGLTSFLSTAKKRKGYHVDKMSILSFSKEDH